MKRIIPLVITFFALHFQALTAQTSNYLHDCWVKQAGGVGKAYLQLTYTEKLNQLEHSFEPWQQTAYTGRGTVWTSADEFVKTDTLLRGKQVYFSKTQLSKTNLLFLDYGDKSLFAITEDAFLDQTFLTARYSPIRLISWFEERHVPEAAGSSAQLAVYSAKINKTRVTLYVRKADDLLEKVTTLSDDELFGDVMTTYTYQSYKSTEGIHYPGVVTIQKINGHVTDEVLMTGASKAVAAPVLLDLPLGYKFSTEATVPQVVTTQYSDHIHFVELKHTDDKVLVVEFAEFLAVEGAPLNSANGELIINEARKIAPAKPIKYFMFGHYHPHYLGGVRAFVHEGAIVLCTPADTGYVSYLAQAPHTLNPDSLQLQPHSLWIEEVKGEKTISDGHYQMKVYVIGQKSAHTKDYMIYYFPEEKLVYEDDLVWIPRVGEIPAAGDRQRGLYQAIEELGLEVTTIVQSWPVTEMGVKTLIPFSELQQSVEKK